MSNRQASDHDLEVFQRWAIVVDDQLREAVDAVVALEDPEAARPLDEPNDVLHSDRSSSDLASDLVEEIYRRKEYPERPAWFTPAFQMVLWVSTWATFLMDYVEDVTRHGSNPSGAQVGVILEKIAPAIEHFDRFLKALRASGYLSESA